VAFTPDGQRFLTGGRDNAVRFWSVKDGTPAGPILEHKNWVEDVAVSPDGRFVVTGCVDRSTRLWSLTTGRLLWSHWKHTRTVYSVAFSADGQRVATASEDKTARIWSIPTPVEGNVERVQLSTEAMTGLEMDAGGGILWLDPAALRERRGQLDAIGEEPSG
jgi:WD40 repeat protein